MAFQADLAENDVDMKWKIDQKDIKNLKAANLDKKALLLIDTLKENPFKNPPPYEKLVGELKDFYSRRINIQHRLVYQVFEKEKIASVIGYDI